MPTASCCNLKARLRVATYPYTSSQASIFQAFAQLRKNFPAKVDAEYLKRFGIAPANESYIIGILRFLDLIDDESGARVDNNTDFYFGTEEKFRAGLEKRLRDAYTHLFEEMGDEALTAEQATLTHWFRGSDKTSALVGQRQATTFQLLSALAGYGEVPSVKTPQPKKPAETKMAAKKTPAKVAAATKHEESRSQRGGSTKDKDAGSVDAIFASIKKHLMS
jgi:hypothetical protein